MTPTEKRLIEILYPLLQPHMQHRRAVLTAEGMAVAIGKRYEVTPKQVPSFKGFRFIEAYD